MLATKKRKRVTRDIMIISYIFNISIISTLVTIFTTTHNSNWYDLIIGLAISVVIIILLFFSRRVNKIRKVIDRLMLKIAGSLYYQKQNDILIYDYYDKKVLAEVKLNKLPKDLKGKSLQELNLETKHNMRILSIKRKNKIITNVKAGTELYKKDMIVMIGNKNKIDKLFQI